MEYWSSDMWRLGKHLILVMVMSFCSEAGAAGCPEALFAFGASMADTGNSQAADPYQSPPQSVAPYGQTFFGKPANRWSDGRLVVDFFAQALEIPLLSPHLQGAGCDFSRGANFAFSGVTAQNNSFPLAVTSPFYFWVQTKQFRYFKERTRALSEKFALKGTSAADLRSIRAALTLSTKLRYFRSGLYLMMFGNNDFVVPLLSLGQTLKQVESTIATIANAIVANTEELYKHGARTLMVFNVAPLGCSPGLLSSPWMRNMSTVDKYGCLADLNAAIEATNFLIRTDLKVLQAKHPDATFIYADLYTVLQTLTRNGTSYGFKEVFRACCGAGGGAYNNDVRCGLSAIVNGEFMQGKSCSEPATHLYWDGIHITDAAAGFVAKAFLRGEHLEPPYNLHRLCKLNYDPHFP